LPIIRQLAVFYRPALPDCKRISTSIAAELGGDLEQLPNNGAFIVADV
jgi:hypothetical protein